MNYLGLDKDRIEKVSKELNTLLSCYHVYYQNLRKFHWHVEGHNFFDMHQLFEDMYNDARVKIDEIAERVLTLRFRPIGDLSAYLEHSKVHEAQTGLSDEEMIEKILHDHTQIIKCMRTVLEFAGDAHDEGTIDLVAGYLGDIEKRSWMLDAWRKKKFTTAVA